MKKNVCFDIAIFIIFNFGVLKVVAAETVWQSLGDFHYRFERYQEQQTGSPGYNAKIDFIKTRSSFYPQANEIGDYINGRLLQYLLHLRQESMTEQNRHFCSEISQNSQNPCENTLWLSAKGGTSVGTILSLRYENFSAPFAAAHPLTTIETYNFSLNPLFHIQSLADIFTGPDRAFPELMEKIEKKLLAVHDKNGAPLLDKNMVEDGLKNWQSLENFLFSQDGVHFIFNPYMVAPYVFGRLEVTLPYADLPPLKKFYSKALQRT